MVPLDGSDVEGDALTPTVTTPPVDGELVCTAGSCTYTPAADWNGPDSVGFTVSDGELSSAEAFVTITVGAGG